ILVNSNFSDGRAHWKGDVQDPDTNDLATLGEPGAGGGGVVKLIKDKWTKMYQVFVPPDKKLYYTITFQLSSDYKLVNQNNSDTSVADFGDVDAIGFQWTLAEQYWSLITSGNWMTSTKMLQPSLSKKGQKQTLTGNLTDLTPQVETAFLIAFPPGEGSVTFYTASLSKDDPNAQP
ncbi:MAG TPA: hypothetical protein VHY09_14965, partial [Candidatus Methylacidiphilales bacterium]|nr:hypothetical protein [Candidatus Methylacidiphilales bacterium]